MKRNIKIYAAVILSIIILFFAVFIGYRVRLYDLRELFKSDYQIDIFDKKIPSEAAFILKMHQTEKILDNISSWNFIKLMKGYPLFNISEDQDW